MTERARRADGIVLLPCLILRLPDPCLILIRILMRTVS